MRFFWSNPDRQDSDDEPDSVDDHGSVFFPINRAKVSHHSVSAQDERRVEFLPPKHLANVVRHAHLISTPRILSAYATQPRTVQQAHAQVHPLLWRGAGFGARPVVHKVLIHGKDLPHHARIALNQPDDDPKPENARDRLFYQLSHAVNAQAAEMGLEERPELITLLLIDLPHHNAFDEYPHVEVKVICGNEMLGVVSKDGSIRETFRHHFYVPPQPGKWKREMQWAGRRPLGKEESRQLELAHRILHWGNIIISATMTAEEVDREKRRRKEEDPAADCKDQMHPQYVTDRLDETREHWSEPAQMSLAALATTEAQQRTALNEARRAGQSQQERDEEKRRADEKYRVKRGKQEARDIEAARLEAEEKARRLEKATKKRAARQATLAQRSRDSQIQN